jgi:hypothetical protein
MLLLVFSFVSAPFAWSAVCRRFYDPIPSHAIHFERMVMIYQSKEEEKILERGKPLAVEGIAIDGQAGAPARGVLIVVDGRYRFRSSYDISSTKARRLLHDDVMERSGFLGVIDTTKLDPGKHFAQIFVVSRKSQIYPTHESFSFSVL